MRDPLRLSARTRILVLLKQGNQVKVLDMFRGLLTRAKALVARDSIAVIVEHTRFLRKQVTGGCNWLSWEGGGYALAAASGRRLNTSVRRPTKSSPPLPRDCSDKKCQMKGGHCADRAALVLLSPCRSGQRAKGGHCASLAASIFLSPF